jgi:hypothetical protein
MSKAAAIHMAIVTQMAVDNKSPIGLNSPIFAATGGAAGDHKYAEASLRGFAANVAFRLRGDTPPFDFKWPQAKLESWLDTPQWLVESDIASLTDEVGSGKPRDTAVDK